MLDPAAIEETMRRVRRLEIRAKRLVKESFAGEYHSSFKGQGLDFDEFREYQHGDEIRFIDWNVTARMGAPYIRTFREERELSVVLAVDVSGSTVFGSSHLSKRELAAEVAAVLGFSARDNGDKVGLLLFAAEPLLYLPPSKGSRRILRSVREILAASPEQPQTNLPAACHFLTHTLRRRALVFIDQKPLADIFQRKAKLAPAQDQLHAGPFAGAVKARAPFAVGLEQFDIFVIPQCAWRDIESGAHFLECQAVFGHRALVDVAQW